MDRSDSLGGGQEEGGFQLPREAFPTKVAAERNEVREKYQAIAEKTLALLAPELTKDAPRRIRPEAFALVHKVDPSNFTDEDYRFLFNTWECLNVAHVHEIHEE